MISLMIADDHPLLIDGIKTALKGSADIDIVGEANNGFQVLEKLDAGLKVDVILMDLKMPVMDGFEATKLIRELDKDIPIIAQSAYAFAGDRKKAIESGCTDFLSKPLDQKKLIYKINSYVNT